MSRKRYPRADEDFTDKEPVVREAKAQAYGREKDRRSVTYVALNLASVKRRVRKPLKRRKRDIAWALEIAGIGEGPEDLSENARGYLYYSDK